MPRAGGDPTEVLAEIEARLLGERPALVQAEVARRAGVDVAFADELWHLLGFAQAAEHEAAFTGADVRALQLTDQLVRLGVLDADRQEGLVRTLGRSFARLAEWQVTLLADLAQESGSAPTATLLALADDVLPAVEELQTYVWRRHLVSVISRVLATPSGESLAPVQAVLFVDIVGYTATARTLSDRELVSWLEAFEGIALDIVVRHGGRIIKNIGDELLVVTDTAAAAAAIALELTRRGADRGDPFPQVRAGIAYGEVVTRLGDVFGPVVNIAARITKEARPGAVLVDLGMHEALRALTGADADEAAPYRLRRVRRVSAKGYSRLKVWALQPGRA